MSDSHDQDLKGRLGGIWAGFDEADRIEVGRLVANGMSWSQAVEQIWEHQVHQFERSVRKEPRVAIRVMIHWSRPEPSEEIVREIVRRDVPWQRWPAVSIEGGAGPPVWKSGDYTIFHPSWTEPQIESYVRLWERPVLRVDVPLTFALQLGVLNESDAAALIDSGD